MANLTTEDILQGVHDWIKEKIREVVEGENIPALAENLEAWADQKAIATPDTYTDAVRTTGGDIPIETSAGSKLESIKPVAGSKWTAKMLFNGSYNMLNAAKWGAANSQPYVGGVGSNFVYFLVPELTLGTFGTADENNGLLFTDEDGVNVQPTSVYFKPLGATVPQSLTDGTSITPTNVSYDGKTYKDYETSDAGWLIVPKTIYDNDVCAHIAWEDWYDKHVSLDEPTTNPEAVVGTLILEGLLALAHSDKYLRGINEEVCDNVVFGDTSAIITHMVDELSVAANAWTNSATGESDSQGNALYRHSTTVSGIKQGGAACVEGDDGGIPLTVNGTTVSYIDTNATISDAQTVFYQIPTEEETTKSYSDAVFNGSNINQETGVLPINDCSIEAQVGMEGEANITVKYAKNIVDQVAINATVDVPQIKKQVEEHEGRITELEDTAVRTGSYDASVAVGLADNFKGDTIVDAEFYKRKTGGTQSVGSGIATIKEVRGKSIVWKQLVKNGDFSDGYTGWQYTGITLSLDNNTATITPTSTSATASLYQNPTTTIEGHKYYTSAIIGGSSQFALAVLQGSTWPVRIFSTGTVKKVSSLFTRDSSGTFSLQFRRFGDSVTPATISQLYFIDLTLMFGAGNEPATPEEFEKMFPLDYYDYNAGKVIPFAGQNLVTTGFNQWDGVKESGYWDVADGQPKTSAGFTRSKNAIRCLPNTTYYFQDSSTTDGSLGAILYYDANGKYISWINRVRHQQFVTPNNAYYMHFYCSTNFNLDTVCINISDPDRNGTYEPYEKHTLPLDPSQWRDKNGELVFPYGGMHGVGTAYDYAKVDADGYIRNVVRCFEQVDMGSLNWRASALEEHYFFRTDNISSKVKKPQSAWTGANIISPIYERKEEAPAVRTNMCIGISTWGEIRLYDDRYGNDTIAYKSAMQGVPFIYELEEPIEVELATPVYAKYLVDKDGTEEITPANGQEPYTTPANISILYAMDARGEIKNLPKNYLSKESAENMLNAMVSAGVIASYTMTWDSTNNRYVFVITKPAEENQS